MIKSLGQFIDKVQKPLFLIISFIYILCIALFDFLTTLEYSFSLFYLIPIMFLAWYRNTLKAILATIFSITVWFLSEYLSKNIEFSNLAFLWNLFTRLAFYLLVIFLIHRIRIMHNKVKLISNYDFLTGFHNLRHFLVKLDLEIKRSERNGRPFSIAYLDMDNFKMVNDNYGHKSGNELLKYVTNKIIHHIRDIDTPGRIGGDEFAIIFPETDEKNAEIAINNIIKVINDGSFDLKGTSFSIGIISFHSTSISAEEMVSLCDNLMYSAKKTGKNKIVTSTYKE